MKYQIFDWAGNLKFDDQEFDTFEDAWGHVYEYLAREDLNDDEFDEMCGEYYVIAKDQ